MAAKHSARKGTSTEHTVAEGTDIPTTAADIAAATDPVDAVAPVPAVHSDAETAFVPAGVASAEVEAPKRARGEKYVARQRIEIAADAADDRGNQKRTIVQPGQTFAASADVLADLPADAYTDAEEV